MYFASLTNATAEQPSGVELQGSLCGMVQMEDSMIVGMTKVPLKNIFNYGNGARP